ncbi:MAG: tetratricopeptide repeat protein, partial [Nitrospira sp.]|nr:tetratricopeptide repeat protein [Nitrospira sp.]
FGAAIRLRPGDASFWANRANANLTVRNFTAALADFDQALQLAPGDPAYYLGRGRARLFAGDNTASVEDFKTAVRLRPSNPYAMIWLHIARVHGGENDRAELTENAAKVRRDMWPAPMLEYYLDAVDSGQVQAASRIGSGQDQAKRACEAEFFLSESIVHAGQVDQARERLKSVVAGCKLYDVVYSAALAELNLLSK